MVNKSLFSSDSPEWETPRWLFESLHAEFAFSLDPCSTDDNAKCSYHFTKIDNGLKQDWEDHVVFMNPPYGREISFWMENAYESSRQGATVVCLVPDRTDTKWWHGFAMKGEIRLLRGRIQFVGGEHSAPFPSAVIVFRPPSFQITSLTTTSSER